MGDFSAQWLSLREPVDHAARSVTVSNAMLEDLRTRHGNALAGVRVLDLGCGSGSNLRALAPMLGASQQWTLVDYDLALLAAARSAIKAWADTVESERADSLSVTHGGKHLTVMFRTVDLSRDIESVLGIPTDLVTASALFDLVSGYWIERFCDALAAPLYAVLSFDGQMAWEPSHELDDRVVGAFLQHQGSDKGFGPALGPACGTFMSQALQNRGFEVLIDKSPWRIDELPSTFHDMLIEGVAQAALETGRCSVSELDRWLAAHRLARQCIVGHDDLYASKRSMR